jgi:hypothetical protein
MSSLRKIFTLTRTEQHTVLLSFLILLLSFSPLVFNFIWGNHDWVPVLNDLPLSSGLIEGRFSQYILINLLLMGKILPILNLSLGLLDYTYALTLLITRFFAYPIKNTANICAVIAAATLPYITDIIYFHFIVLSQLFWPLVLTLSLLAGKEAALGNHPFRNTALGTALLFLSLGGYPACGNFYVVATVLFLLQNVKTFKQLFRTVAPFCIAVIISYTTLLLCYHYFKQHNLMIELYNGQAETLSGLILKLPHTVKMAFLSLFQPQPFLSLSLKLTVFLVLFLFAYRCFTPERPHILTAFLLLSLVIALKFSAWLTQETATEYFAGVDPAFFMIRADFYAIPVAVLVAFFSLQNSSSFKKNLTFILSLLLLWCNLTGNLEYCKTALFGSKAEDRLLTRITARVQENPAFSASALYNFMQAGELSLRPRYHTPNFGEKYGFYTLNTPFTRFWLPNENYNFSTPAPFVKEKEPLNPDRLSQNLANFITTKLSVWPNENALYLENNLIILALTPGGQNLLRSQFMQFRGH